MVLFSAHPDWEGRKHEIDANNDCQIDIALSVLIRRCCDSAHRRR